MMSTTPTSTPVRTGSRRSLPPSIGLSALGIIGVGLVALAVAVLLSLMLGVATLGPGQVWDALGGGSDAQTQAVMDSRITRTAVGALVGAASAVAGAVLQGVTRNPLADPGIIGINAGAAAAVVMGIYLAGIATVGGYVGLALLGGAAAAVAVNVIAGLGPSASRPVTMALAGAAITAGCSSLTGGIMVSSEAALEAFRFWQVGSVAGRDLGALWPVLPLFAVGFVFCLFCGPVLNALALGDDLARGLGQQVRRGHFTCSAAAVLLCASATAVAGPIAFVGLVVPHTVRMLVGPDYRRILWGALLGGPVLMILADTLGRMLARPNEISVGIVTAVIGAPTLILLVRRARVAE